MIFLWSHKNRSPCRPTQGSLTAELQVACDRLWVLEFLSAGISLLFAVEAEEGVRRYMQQCGEGMGHWATATPPHL